jgi:hypothetical protein
MTLKIKRIISIAAGAVLVGSVFWRSGLQDLYQGYPLVPIPASGRVVPDEIKGRIVFITEKQHQILDLLEYIGYAAGILCILVLVVHGGDPFKKPPPNNFTLPTARRRSWWFW